MDVQQFENNRWRSGGQKIVFRHRACLELIASGTVLDLGCGDGLLLSLLKEKGLRVAGLDLSDEAVRRCAARGIEARAHSLEGKLPYTDGEFDTVVLLDVLEHLYDPASVLAEAARIARQRVIVGVPNFSSLPARLQALCGKVPENNRPNKGHVYWFNHRVLAAMAGKNGLKIVRSKTNTFFPLSFLGTVGRKVACLWPNMLALSFVVSLEKSR
jgi:methionine biosynthesis protein MetW